MLRKIRSLFNPEMFHGWNKDKRYFEGWYYKIFNADQSHAYAIIPGIAMDEKGEKQAFIQILDGINYTAAYHKFDADLFQASDKKFELTIGDNYFSEERLVLNLPDFHAMLKFEHQFPWPNKWYSPGIMGPFSFIPFMECYHGILSMDHEVSGVIELKKELINFDKGRGYIEKDWGRSFPEAYIWLQCNHFSKPGISIKASVAKIPWLGSHFVGFIAGLVYDGQLIRFTTYNFTSLKRSMANLKEVNLVFENRNYKLTIKVIRDHATSLASPILGFMDGRIEESMTSEIEITLLDKKTKTHVIKERSSHAALEVAGKIELITIDN